MDKDGVKAKRAELGATQADFAKLLGVSRILIAKVESGGAPVSAEMARKVQSLGKAPASIEEPAPASDPRELAKDKRSVKAKKRDAERAKALAGLPPAEEIKASPALLAAMKRRPLFAKTSKEAKAMRRLRAQETGQPLGHVRLLPLCPDWQTVGARKVNAAIPAPIDEAPPSWAGWRGVLTRSGAVYDFETADKVSPLRMGEGAIRDTGGW